MDHRRVDSLALSAWSADDSRRNSEDENVHRVMDDASDHDDHVTQDAHIASEQQHHSRFESDGRRYRASHSRPHPSSPPMPSTPVVGGLVVVPPTVHMSSISARRKYLVKLSRALIIYGAPTRRLEEYMSMSLRALEIEGEFSYIPNCMTISFDESTADAAQVKLVRVSEGIDLGRLQDVHDISMDVAHDRLGVKEAARRLDEVLGKSPKFKVWFRILIYGLASACVAPFGFEGRFIDLPIAFILGCIYGLHAYVFDFFAAVVTSFLARGFGSINDGRLFCFSILAQSSIVMCLPGYVVLGSLELQGDKIVAGSTRMVHAMGYMLRLGCGIPIGAALYGMMDSNATSEAHCNKPLAREWCFLFVPGFTPQIPAMLATAMAGFCAVSYSTEYLTNHFSPNAQIPTMLGSLIVAILASLYSRLSERVQSLWPDFVDFWRCRVQPRLLRRPQADAWPLPSPSDPEANAVPPPGRPPRKVRHSLAAATSLPGLLVLVPAGLVATGSLLAGIHVTAGAVNATTFHLGLSALILYPLGKRRSGLTSF
ncbi:hypothetical protein E4U52_005838 [Claviceps spartinae]|nr:hypothetical protein E4U52_005838 [Claviceps spartinae]